MPIEGRGLIQFNGKSQTLGSSRSLLDGSRGITFGGNAIATTEVEERVYVSALTAYTFDSSTGWFDFTSGQTLYPIYTNGHYWLWFDYDTGNNTWSITNVNPQYDITFPDSFYKSGSTDPVGAYTGDGFTGNPSVEVSTQWPNSYQVYQGGANPPNPDCRGLYRQDSVLQFAGAAIFNSGFMGSGELDLGGNALFNRGFIGSGSILFAGQAEIFRIQGSGTIAFGGTYKFIPAVWPIYHTIGGFQFGGRCNRQLSAKFVSIPSLCCFSSAFSRGFESFCCFDFKGLGLASIGFHKAGSGGLAFGGHSTQKLNLKAIGGGTIFFFAADGLAELTLNDLDSLTTAQLYQLGLMDFDSQEQIGFPRVGNGSILFSGSNTKRVGFHKAGSGSLAFGGHNLGRLAFNRNGSGGLAFGGSGASKPNLKAIGGGTIFFFAVTGLSQLTTDQLASLTVEQLAELALFARGAIEQLGLLGVGRGTLALAGLAHLGQGRKGLGGIKIGSNAKISAHLPTTGHGGIAFGGSGIRGGNYKETGSGILSFIQSAFSSGFNNGFGNETAIVSVALNPKAKGTITFTGQAILKNWYETGRGAMAFAGHGEGAATSISPEALELVLASPVYVGSVVLIPLMEGCIELFSEYEAAEMRIDTPEYSANLKLLKGQEFDYFDNESELQWDTMNELEWDCILE